MSARCKCQYAGSRGHDELARLIRCATADDVVELLELALCWPDIHDDRPEVAPKLWPDFRLYHDVDDPIRATRAAQLAETIAENFAAWRRLKESER